MKPNAYAAECPTRQILDRVADKWAVLILLLVRGEPMRFNALRRAIEGISQKMLSQVLKSLERDGLVRRRAIATVPVTVEYSITPLGATLAGAVDPLREGAETNLKEVLNAQRRSDAARKQSKWGVERAAPLRRGAQFDSGVNQPPLSCPASSGASSTPRPLGRARAPLEYWADSVGRRNTSAKEVAMKRYRWRSDRCVRAALRSPGRLR